MKQRSIVWRAGQESSDQVTVTNLPTSWTSDEVVWLDLAGPTSEDLDQMADHLHLDAHTVEDALSAHERPKIIHLGDYSFLTAYITDQSKGRVHISRISAYVFDRMLITIHPGDDDGIADIVQRWRQDPHLVSWGVYGLLQGLMDTLVDAQFTTLEALDIAADDLARRLFAAKPNVKTLQKRTFFLRGELVTLHRVIPQTRDIVATIIRRGMADEWPLELRTYWEDVNDHVIRSSEWTDSLRDMVTSIFEASLALNDSRMNEVMKKLAAWAAIIAVPTLITGWFGMNVPYPGFSSLSGLLTSIGLIVAAATGLFIVFKKHDWL